MSPYKALRVISLPHEGPTICVSIESILTPNVEAKESSKALDFSVASVPV